MGNSAGDAGGFINLSENADHFKECAPDICVILQQKRGEVYRTKTDTFGEFVIDGLVPNSGRYQLKFSEQKTMEFEQSEESRYLGVIKLPIE